MLVSVGLRFEALFLLLTNDIFSEEIVTTDSIDFSDAETNLFLSLDIKYHVPANVNNITNK